MTKSRLRKALAAMLSVEEIGSGLPLRDRSYQVRLHTKGSTISLTSYSISGTTCDGKRGKANPAGAKDAAESAREYFIDQIADRIHFLGVSVMG